VLISLDGAAPSRMVSVTASVYLLFLLAPAHPDSPGKMAVKWVCVYSQCTVQQCVLVLYQSLPLSIPKSTFHHSHHHEVAGYTTAPREVFSLPSSLPSGDMSTSFVAWPATRKVIFTITLC